MNTVEIVWARADGTSGQADDLLRQELARRCGIEPTQVKIDRLCPSCGSGKHGRPIVSMPADLTALRVSISRSPDLVAVAFTDAGSIGIDVERADAPTFAGFASVALHLEENDGAVRDRAITWVRKESLLKATGDGLDIDPSTVRLSRFDEIPMLLEWTSPKPQPASVWMRDLDIDPDHVAAVSLLSGEAVEISVREADPVARVD